MNKPIHQPTEAWLKMSKIMEPTLKNRPYDDIDRLSESIVDVVEKLYPPKSTPIKDQQQTDRFIAACGRAAMFFLETRGGSEKQEELFYLQCRTDLKFFKAVFRQKRYEKSKKE